MVLGTNKRPTNKPLSRSTDTHHSRDHALAWQRRGLSTCLVECRKQSVGLIANSVTWNSSGTRRLFSRVQGSLDDFRYYSNDYGSHATVTDLVPLWLPLSSCLMLIMEKASPISSPTPTCKLTLRSKLLISSYTRSILHHLNC